MESERRRDKQKEFFGMKYPFSKCGRPALIKMDRCLECSVREFCEAPEKVKNDNSA